MLRKRPGAEIPAGSSVITSDTSNPIFALSAVLGASTDQSTKLVLLCRLAELSPSDRQRCPGTAGGPYRAVGFGQIRSVKSLDRVETSSSLVDYHLKDKTRAGWLMSELFRWHIQFPEAITLARRAEECRRLAKIVPEYSREDFLKLAADYEQLAREAIVRRAESWPPPKGQPRTRVRSANRTRVR